MKKSLLIIAFGIGVGYVFGTRAGRERYDQIVEAANGVWEDPRVAKARREAARYARQQAPVVRDKAQAVAKATPGAVAEGAKATAAAARNVAGRTASTARGVADRATGVASAAVDKAADTAADVATKAGEVRDSALEDTALEDGALEDGAE